MLKPTLQQFGKTRLREQVTQPVYVCGDAEVPECRKIRNLAFRCYLCGHTTAEIIADKDSIRMTTRSEYGVDKMVCRCLQCNLYQLFPAAEPLYNGYANKVDFPGQKRKVRISKYLKKMIGDGFALEVGCGHGDNIKYLDRKGLLVIGIDKDPSVCNGVSVLNHDWEELQPYAYNTIYAIHLLEHLVDPKKFIKWVVKNLSDNGKFIFEIPCVEDPLIGLYKNKAYGKFCWYPYHMFFYSKDTVKTLFGSLDIKITRRQTYGIINHLRWWVLGRPGNVNWNIPIIDHIYKFILTRLGYSDTLIIVGQKCLT